MSMTNDYVISESSRRYALLSLPSDETGPVGGSSKRVLDVIVASIALVLLTPIFVMIAAAIKLSTGGPVFYRHKRVGFGGDTFECLKFCSMVPNSAERLAAYLASNSAAAREWQQTRKLRHDPRITQIGHILRKSSLDELPQLWNVLLGDMSCVGPRPVVSDELERYGEAGLDYQRARPGITGLWQVSGRSDTSYERRVQLDKYYVRRWSFVFDLWIMAQTIPAVLKTDETA